ncbi:bifunctional helix-turn-helix transcriptional regulator/GNAT family N-acetyltransferase [Frigidibacter sp. ROC022]|uniref:bifunctional helix-turn-helix transcriptional regulator/GNAT family N-acetyltransferase n=1 Tax=Frigidibacter sp. ROC022 TaxID=2971796 RepID=UPI00215A6719|nr:helix-turn-helix domain-containing GNAT family N-acetyltransferase [Frigidibacter sp. ROC022]MCR8725839.1 helix-turn-helix domain-containing GNAT family N-acetyltransferase [Frigidibacter sp. ROC022]
MPTPATDPPDPIARMRRFNRAVTVEVGALDSSFLGRGRPLGAARVLTAIGPEGRDVAAIRETLKLDSGLMSRLLRGLEAEGLLTVARDPDDGRRRIARLTPAGAAEVAQYDALSNDRAARLLAAHPRPEALLAAMDLIATALGRDRIEITHIDPEAPAARHCLQNYYAELAQRFETGFDPATSLDPEAAALRPPLGRFLVAMSDGLPVGAVALKGNGTETGELKRLWVAPAARGLGLARRLMAEAQAAARELGMTRLRLDTNRALTEAIALYRRDGWTEIPAFNTEPYAHHWFEKSL